MSSWRACVEKVGSEGVGSLFHAAVVGLHNGILVLRYEKDSRPRWHRRSTYFFDACTQVAGVTAVPRRGTQRVASIKFDLDRRDYRLQLVSKSELLSTGIL